MTRQQGWTLSEYDRWLAEADLPPKAARRATAIRRKYAASIRRPVLARYETDAKALTHEEARLQEEVGALGEAARLLADGLEAGEVDARAARRDLTRVFADLEQARHALDALTESEDAAWQRACQPPEVSQAEQLERFPTLRERLPLIHPEHLTGELADPFDD